MDWLEEKLEQFRAYIRNASLLKGFLAYLSVGAVAALTICAFTRNICISWIYALLERGGGVQDLDDFDFGMYLYLEGGRQFPLRLSIGLYNYCLYIYLTAAFIVIAKLFIEYKIKPAVFYLMDSIHAVAAGDLGREMTYHSEDELGRLCCEFEFLRRNLIQEKRKDWDEQEEQRKINAAFAHDIRTPLTVIKGYTEFLLKYIPTGKVTEEMLTERLSTILYQENRLMLFTKTMTSIQEVEKREIHCRWISLLSLAAMMKAAAESLAGELGKQVHMEVKEPDCEIFVDREVILENFDNVLSNAFRYAGKQIDISITMHKRRLFVYVKDDGSGFSGRALREAKNFYYSEAEKNGQHFGMGLALCRILCEKHGGNLTLMNSVENGAIVTASYWAGMKA